MRPSSPSLLVRSLIAGSAAALVLVTVLTASHAAAFSCPQRGPRDLAPDAQVVVGGVIEAESAFGMRVRVDRVYQGTAERTITVLPSQGNASRVGLPWTFYLLRNAFAFTYTDCGGTHPGVLSAEEASFFGPGGAPTSDQLLFGQVGNVIAGLGVLLTMLFVITRRRRPPLTPAGAHP